MCSPAGSWPSIPCIGFEPAENPLPASVHDTHQRRNLLVYFLFFFYKTSDTLFVLFYFVRFRYAQPPEGQVSSCAAHFRGQISLLFSDCCGSSSRLTGSPFFLFELSKVLFDDFTDEE